MGHPRIETLIQRGGQIKKKYDLMGRVISISHSQWKEENIIYDKMGNLTDRDVTDNLSGAVETRHEWFQYNCLDMLLIENGAESHCYEYDSLYNRMHKNGQPYTNNDLHQLIQYGTTKCQYDSDGNLLSVHGEKNITCQYV